ncbi:MAG TPA: diaminopimelate epimerase [Thermoanaerobaculia bacterium]|jgi:diaminopimelate epimerase|nr:diaminopimelate epimerase [Thermoanaerobaculia bacterium]
MTRFFKVSGSGNDFLALAEPDEEPSPERIQAWCHRGVSLGADGLFVLRREDGGAAMDYYNSDGRPADLCLNGTRCAAQLLFHLGWAEGSGRVRTHAGAFAARRLDESRIALTIPAPAAEPREMEIDVEDRSWRGWSLTVGVPHFVLAWRGHLGEAPVRELGRAIRFHPSFAPAGTNVSFVRFPAEHRLEIRTYERGVEDETLSCGTGVLAATAVGLHLGRSALPLHVLTQGGFELEVAAGEPGVWTFSGDARIVAAGDLLPGADPSPSPPAWS